MGTNTGRNGRRVYVCGGQQGANEGYPETAVLERTLDIRLSEEET